MPLRSAEAADDLSRRSFNAAYGGHKPAYKTQSERIQIENKRGDTVSVKIIVPEYKIRPYFVENIAKLRAAQHQIAENTETGVEVYLTEKNGSPCFSVDIDGATLGEIVTSVTLMEEYYEEILSKFVINSPVKAAPKLTEEEESRVEEIHDAWMLFLHILFEADPNDFGFTEEDSEELLSNLELSLNDEHGILIRHPTIFNGKVVQFPAEPDFIEE